MGRSHKEVLTDALEAEIGRSPVAPETIFTEDVAGWSPYGSVSGLTELCDLAARREKAFSNLALTLRGLDEVGNKAYAEWLIEADHTGPLVMGGDVVVDATGRHVRLAGVTVADFREGKIRSYRTYFDDVSLLEQLVAV